MVWNHEVREELTFSHDCCCVLSHFSVTLQLRRTRLLCHSSPSSQLFVALLSCSRTDWGRRSWLGPPPVQSTRPFTANAGRTHWKLEAVKTNEWVNSFWRNLTSHQTQTQEKVNQIRAKIKPDEAKHVKPEAIIHLSAVSWDIRWWFAAPPPPPA